MKHQASEKENVLMVIPNYGFGGAQRVFSQLVSCLSEQYNVIEVVFNNDEVDVYGGVGRKVSLEIEAGSNFFFKAINFLKRCKKLNKLKIKFACKASISHMEGANYINVLSFGPGKKILCVHGSKMADDSNRKGIIKFIENQIFIPLLFNLSDKIVTVSYGIKEELVRFFRIPRSKIQVIQNGIDIKKIKDMSHEEIPFDHQIIFKKRVSIYSGRLASQKNPTSLIDIYKSSCDRADYNLLILGDGPLKFEMQNKCVQFGIDFYDDTIDNHRNTSAPIFFIGFQGNPFKYLQRSTLFVLPSNFEGFPLAPCEALACCLPVIATDCPTGVREILSPTTQPTHSHLKLPEYAEYGVLMPVLEWGKAYDQYVDVWSDTVVKMLSDDNLQHHYRQNASVRASALSIENFEKNWKDFLVSSFN
jgi:glycosyltransferase involved in cell wall biosynthesis